MDSMSPKTPLLRGVAVCIAVLAYAVLWDLTGLPSPVASGTYTLLLWKLFALIGLLVSANFLVNWVAGLVQRRHDRPHEDA